MDDLPLALERLTARLESLERRVAAMEQPAAAPASNVVEQAAVSDDGLGEGLSLAQAGGVFPVLGKAMLGVAGAYLLRAVAETTALPRLALAAVAVAYALAWLVWAARQKAGEAFASTVYAATSALILAPMLWELTLRFRELPAPVTASVLAGFVCAASALAWKRDQTPVFWVGNAAGAIAALALAVATHELTPFLAALLLMALINECAAVLGHELSVRPLVAATADLAVWATIFIYSSAQTTRTEYPAMSGTLLIAPGCLLFVIYAAGIVLRCAVRGEQIGIFETGQALVAILLAVSGVLYFAPAGSAVSVGAVCLLLAAGCYFIVFLRFSAGANGRNARVFGMWAAALLLAGALLGLPAAGAGAALGVAAVAATLVGVRLARTALLFHGLVFLAAAALQSGLLAYAFGALAGTLPSGLAWSICVVAACAIVSYAVVRPCNGETWKQQALHLLSAAFTVCAVAALLAQGLLWLATLRITPELHHIAFIRTLAACAVAVALAYAGARLHRIELTRLAYASLGLIALKLLMEDLRHGHLEFIAGSIFLFAIALIAVPRMARLGQQPQPSH